MKRFYILLITMLFAASLSMKAQIPNGSEAPDFTATDINGVEHHLYDYLDQGKTVIIDFFATWCSPCWTYHERGILEEAWQLYGPDGTDELVIFQIETDPTTGMDDLQNSEYGSWLEGVEYYTIDDNPTPSYPGSIIAYYYQIPYVPSIFIICPSRMFFFDNHLSPKTVEEIIDFSRTDCNAATEQIDAAITGYTGQNRYCDDLLKNPKVKVKNYGLGGDINQFVIQTILDEEVIHSYTYPVNIPLFHEKTVTVASIPDLPDTPNVTFKILVDGDSNPDNDELSPDVRRAFSVPTDVVVEVQPDDNYEDFSFAMIAESGTVLYKCNGIENNELHSFEISFPENTCIEWKIYDANSDGIPNGYVRLLNSNTGEELIYIDGEDIISEYKEMITTVQYENITENEIVTNIYPNPAKDFVKIEGDIDNVKIYNALGQIISITDENIIDVSRFNKGIYLFNITMRNGKVESRKVVME